jgi:hypothetical protein
LTVALAIMTVASASVASWLAQPTLTRRQQKARDHD